MQRKSRRYEAGDWLVSSVFLLIVLLDLSINIYLWLFLFVFYLQKFVSKVEERFLCICCQEIVFKPITTTCLHNICINCLQRSFRAGVYTCPHCRHELGKNLKMEPNEELCLALNAIFPGYENGRWNIFSSLHHLNVIISICRFSIWITILLLNREQQVLFIFHLFWTNHLIYGTYEKVNFFIRFTWMLIFI